MSAGNDVVRMPAARARKILANFRDGEQLTVIPAKRTRKLVVFAWLAERFTAGVVYSEREVNAALAVAHPDGAGCTMSSSSIVTTPATDVPRTGPSSSSSQTERIAIHIRCCNRSDRAFLNRIDVRSGRCGLRVKRPRVANTARPVRPNPRRTQVGRYARGVVDCHSVRINTRTAASRVKGSS